MLYSLFPKSSVQIQKAVKPLSTYQFKRSHKSLSKNLLSAFAKMGSSLQAVAVESNFKPMYWPYSIASVKYGLMSNGFSSGTDGSGVDSDGSVGFDVGGDWMVEAFVQAFPPVVIVSVVLYH